jgi:serine/threonine protein phosphatase 1
MMLDARHDETSFADWYACGGKQTLESYKAQPHWEMFAQSIPAAHWRFLEETCQPYYENDTHFFVHANAYPAIPLNEQPDFMLYWEPLDIYQSKPHESGKVMICGHSAQRSGRPLDLDHAVCIDTWVYGDGWLTCLDVGSGEYWQANQECETRTGKLNDY